jgi:hypothetical protein
MTEDAPRPPIAPAKHRRNLIAALAAGGTAALAARAAIAQPGPTPSSGGSSSLALGFSSTTALAGNLGGVDDPANSSGLGAPAIIRGTVYGHLASGLTVGTGLSQSVQAANATALQNAINYAVSAGKFFELIPNTYQIYSSLGLNIPACSGFVWRGSMYDTIIEQFYASGQGAPVLLLGDSAGVSASNGWDFYGAKCIYGVAQTGLILSQAVMMTCHSMSKIGGLNLFSNYPPYNGFAMNGGALGNFSNVIDTIIIEVVQNHFFVVYDQAGTGNIIDNIYMNNGGDGAMTPPAISGSYISVAVGSLPTEWEFRRVNCEWGMCTPVINITGALGFHFGELHIEGITLGSAAGSYDPKLIATTQVSGQFDCLNLINIFIQSTYASGTPALLQDYTGGASMIKINTFTWYNDTSGNINIPCQLYNPAGGGAPDDTLIFGIENSYLRDSAGTGGSNFGNHLAFDDNMPTANFNWPQKFGRYTYGVGGSRVEYAQIPVNATYTHYGQHYWATILVPAAITSFTLTLAHTVGANGTRPTPAGNVVRVHRHSGTASGTLTIADATAGTLSTNTTAATDYYYYFNGTAYTAFTPEATS